MRSRLLVVSVLLNVLLVGVVVVLLPRDRSVPVPEESAERPAHVADASRPPELSPHGVEVWLEHAPVEGPPTPVTGREPVVLKESLTIEEGHPGWALVEVPGDLPPPRQDLATQLAELEQMVEPIARGQAIAELAKNWIVFLGGTILAVFFLGSGIIGVFDGTFDELAKVSNAALPFAGLLFGYAVGKTVSGGSDNGKDDE